MGVLADILFCKAVVKAYLHGACDAGSGLMFKFRWGTHGLNEELGRHRGREGRKECLYIIECDDECESVNQRFVGLSGLQYSKK